MNKAFTLIEFLIVVGIIAILAAAIVIAVSPGERLAQARDSTRENHLHSLHTSLSSYLVSGGTHPETVEGVMREICNTNELDSNDCEGHDLVDLTMLDLPRIPIDPQGGDHEYGTGYYVGTGSIRLHAPKAETRIVSVNDGWAHNGLVGWWRLDDGEGTDAEDSSGNENHGTLEGSPTWKSGLDCVGAGCLEFDGENDYVQVSRSPDLNIPHFTYAVWVKPASVHAGMVIRNGREGGHIQITPTNTVVGFNDGEGWWGHHDGSYTPDEWVHIAGVLDNGILRLYVDGVFVGTPLDTGRSPATPTADLFIGIRQDGVSHFDGLIDDPRIYNRALSVDEIELLHAIR